MRRYPRSDLAVGVAIAALIVVGIAWSLAMLWWLVWSILDLANGNPATGWNVLGVIIPSISILGTIAQRARR